MDFLEVAGPQRSAAHQHPALRTARSREEVPGVPGSADSTLDPTLVCRLFACLARFPSTKPLHTHTCCFWRDRHPTLAQLRAGPYRAYDRTNTGTSSQNIKSPCRNETHISTVKVQKTRDRNTTEQRSVTSEGHIK